MVGVSGFEPEASWSRTKRDTKLRHTPKAKVIISIILPFVKQKRIFWEKEYFEYFGKKTKRIIWEKDHKITLR